MDRGEMLLQLAGQQGRVMRTMTEAELLKAAGDAPRAHAAYQAHLDVSREYLKGIEAYNRAYPETPFTVPDVVQPIVNALLTTADVASALGKQQEAQRLRTEAQVLVRTYLGAKAQAEVDRSLAGAWTLEGRFNEAIVALLHARDMCLAQQDDDGLVRVTLDLADIFQWLGDYGRAAEELARADEAVAPRVPQGIGLGAIASGILGSVASILAGKGDPGTALASMQLFRAYHEIRFFRGLIAKAAGRWEEAEAYFREVLPQYAKLGEAGVGVEFQLADVQVRRGAFDEALQALHRMAPAFDGGLLRGKRAVLKTALARCLRGRGDAGQALAAVDEAIADLRSHALDPDALWRAQHLRAALCGDLGERDGELAGYEQAISTISGLRRAPLGFRLDSTFLADKRELFSDAISAAARSGAHALCCRFIEELKSRTLRVVLGVGTPPGEQSELDARFDEVARRLDALDYQIAKGQDPAAKEKATTQRLLLLAERASLLERLRVSDPRWRRLSEPVPFDLDTVLASLRERRQAAITLHFDPPRATAVLLYEGEASAQAFALPPALAATLAGHAHNMAASDPDPFLYDLAEEGVETGDLIPPALLRRALAADSLVVVPHGVLHLVPWAGLMHEGQRLFQQLPVAVLPNLACLAGCDPLSKPQVAAVLGVGHYQGYRGFPDLAEAVAETREVAATYVHSGARVLGPTVDADATAECFWRFAASAAGAPSILHVSCHGELEADEPMNSGLLLADARVDAAEIARGRLPYDEAVLSACSTGWRPSQVQEMDLHSDEVLGIPGGFLEAGVRAVLVSIPKAEEHAARRITTRYHEERSRGASPLHALQAAQRAMLDARTLPALWIGFTLYGCE
jgi:tetratricopeptide (TPR) repeat protein